MSESKQLAAAIFRTLKQRLVLFQSPNCAIFDRIVMIYMRVKPFVLVFTRQKMPSLILTLVGMLSGEKWLVQLETAILIAYRETQDRHCTKSPWAINL